MKKEIKRNYLEIKSLNELAEVSKSLDVYSINFLDPPNFQLNKFFYKNIGKDHHWVDRLVWSEKEWIDYVSNEKVSTYIL
ncbi:MAG: GNAT family N-acetyltransferase, partial [Proteobacteria bacterium]|nr:GNAT family N-acetyltransferase [Pseudomonadota bacterium]